MKKWILPLLVLPIIIFLVFINPTTYEKHNHFKIGIARWINAPSYTENIQGFIYAMNESGYVEGNNTDYIIESADLNQTKQREIINDFINKKVDLIYSLTTPGTLIAKNMTQTIPIVFSIVTYPVEAGVIETLEHSGNNLVGTRNYVNAKTQLDQFSDIAPVKKIGFVHHMGEPNSAIQYDEMKKAGSEEGIEVIDISAKDISDLTAKTQNAIGSVDAFYQACDTLIQNGGEDIAIKVAMEHKKPTFSCNLAGVEDGGLFGDVANFSEIGYISGHKAALVLNGASPDDIYTETQPHGDIVINLKTANYLGIRIPVNIMAVADKVFR